MKNINLFYIKRIFLLIASLFNLIQASSSAPSSANQAAALSGSSRSAAVYLDDMSNPLSNNGCSTIARKSEILDYSAFEDIDLALANCVKKIEGDLKPFLLQTKTANLPVTLKLEFVDSQKGNGKIIKIMKVIAECSEKLEGEAESKFNKIANNLLIKILCIMCPIRQVLDLNLNKHESVSLYKERARKALEKWVLLKQQYSGIERGYISVMIEHLSYIIDNEIKVVPKGIIKVNGTIYQVK